MCVSTSCELKFLSLVFSASLKYSSPQPSGLELVVVLTFCCLLGISFGYLTVASSQIELSAGILPPPFWSSLLSPLVLKNFYHHLRITPVIQPEKTFDPFQFLSV